MTNNARAFHHVAFKSHVCTNYVSVFCLSLGSLCRIVFNTVLMVMICVYRCAAPGCELAEDRPRHSLQRFSTHAIKVASHDHHRHTLLTAPPVVLSARDSNLELNGRSYSGC